MGNQYKSDPLEKRFNAHVIQEPNSGCHLWIGATSGFGYGNIKVAGKTTKSHRVAWEMKFGPIPVGMRVLHKCDTPCCVNTSHLFLGSDLDNARDRESKNRNARIAAKGSSHYKAILKECDISVIRNDSRIARIISADYGVSKDTIYAVKQRKSWRHI